MSDSIEYPPLFLKTGEDARLRAGHLWVFANEVDVKRSPLTDFQPGDTCVLVDAKGKGLGIGYVNPASLICARMVSRGLNHDWDRSLLVHRIKVALGLRERLFDSPHYRLLFGESDGVPGLTLDRFGDVIVAQATTAGIERIRDDVAEAVQKVLKPAAMIWKNDAGIREMEGLPSCSEMAFGEIDGPVSVMESGVEFRVDVREGQKTGWFYDQRANRDLLARLFRGKRVLDMFSYLGGWGLRAAAAGASEVVCVDASASAVAAVEANAALNGLSDRISAVRADAFDHLRQLREQREHFDIVILDPPAFVKRKKHFREGRDAYRRLNELGMQVCGKDGLLATFSCSYHMPRAALLDGIQRGARHLDRQVQVLSQLQQSPDHPLHPAIPETDYLKGFLCRVLPA